MQNSTAVKPASLPLSLYAILVIYGVMSLSERPGLVTREVCASNLNQLVRLFSASLCLLLRSTFHLTQNFAPSCLWYIRIESWRRVNMRNQRLMNMAKLIYVTLSFSGCVSILRISRLASASVAQRLSHQHVMIRIYVIASWEVFCRL